MKRIVLDLDVGTDDAFALLVLLHAEKLGLVKLEAIVCTMGNASLEDVTKNVVRILETVKRTDIPIYKGATGSIIPLEKPLDPYHGKDSFGDLEYDTEPDLSIIQKTPASIAIRDLVVNNPGEITFMCIGPLTNVALAMKIFDDFAPNIKEMFILGGNYAATGNVTETAEFNFYVDPEAAHIVLQNAGCPITIATWETCLNAEINFEWRFGVLGTRETPFMKLMNRVEKKVNPDVSPSSPYLPCDTLIVVTMLYPEKAILQSDKYNATVELHGAKTRGQTVLDHLKKKEPNVIVVKKVDDEVVKQALLQAADSII